MLNADEPDKPGLSATPTTQRPVKRPVKRSPKRAVNLSLNAQVLDKARELGMNLSATVDVLLAEAVQQRYWERWNSENRAAIEHYNARIEAQGLPLARYRTFLKER